MQFKGKNKESYITNILNRVKTMYEKIELVNQVERYMKNQYFNGISPIHQTYVTRFNAVDMGDHWYAQVDDHHRVYEWHSKMLTAILRLGMVNVWVYHCQKKYNDWVDFRRELGKQMIA